VGYSVRAAVGLWVIADTSCAVRLVAPRVTSATASTAARVGVSLLLSLSLSLSLSLALSLSRSLSHTYTHTHPHAGTHVVAQLEAFMAARDGAATTLANVHRLDKGTSGLLLLSKTKAAAAALGKQFKSRKVEKKYWAALRGTVAAEPVRVTPPPPQCTALSLIPTVNGSTVRSFPTHGQQSAAKGSSTTVSRSDIRLIQHLDSSALGLVRRGRS
jgi:hypothetical protein